MKKSTRHICLPMVLVGLGSLLAVLLTACGKEEVQSNNLLTRYTFDPVQKQWVASVVSTPTVPNPDGSMPRGSNTVEIFLQEDEPVKAILIAEALVIKGEDPIIEIAGRASSSGARGKIQICTLVLKKVEAKRLEVKDTQVVKVDVFNTVAQDNELDVEIEPVNVVRCGRGATTVISLGVDRKDVDLGYSGSKDSIPDIMGKDRDSGVRIDRLRILGPEGKTGFVENLIVLRTSAFGEIEIRDVRIQELVLDSVTLDDFSPAP